MQTHVYNKLHMDIHTHTRISVNGALDRWDEDWLPIDGVAKRWCHF